jgi:site-specific DNA recombinase
MRAVVYARVSTDAQERDGTSLDTQERAGVERVLGAGWSLVECIRDAARGYTLDRPGITRVRQLLRQGAADIVVAYSVDRLSRNQNHIGVLFYEVEQAGARLELVTEQFESTAIGRFILAARAFSAEVEREMIAERTTRGKLERARSGRIPQAMGKGCYGYVYNPRTGQREIDEAQAEVVRWIFRRYLETRSYSRVASELNESGVQAFAGGRWYPLTIRRILMNESYTGRLVYRRTRWVVTGREGVKGGRRRRPVPRPVEEWVEIAGASPRIVDQTVWERVQAILADPERTRQRTTPRLYVLRGRAKCGVCGAAIVGQTMHVKGSAYTYYACRHAYNNHVREKCSARYIRGETLENGIWREVRRVLTDPAVVLQELQQQTQQHGDPDEMERVEVEIKSLLEREKRLVRLFSFGELDEQVVRDEGANLRRQRALLQSRLDALCGTAAPAIGQVDAAALSRTCAGVAKWLDDAGPAERVQVLEALQVAIVATREAATVRGVLPITPPNFAQANDHADAGQRLALERAFRSRLGHDRLDKGPLGFSEAGDVLAEDERQRPLQVRVRARDLRVLKQVVAEQDELFPAWAGRLHHVDVVRPGPGHALAEEQLLRQPCFVLGHVGVAERLERRDGGRAGFGQAANLDEQVDDRLGGQPRHGGAADVLDDHDYRAERAQQARSLFVEQDGPRRVVVADHDRPAAVPLHAHLLPLPNQRAAHWLHVWLRP